MSSRTQPRPAVRLLALGLPVIASLTLTACGSSSSAEPSQSAPADPGGQGGNFGGADMQKIFACLKAAGIDVPDLPSGMPSGRPSGMPTDLPSGAPSAMPSGRPSGTPSNMRGRGVDFTDPKVSAALKACGLSVPSNVPMSSQSS